MYRMSSFFFFNDTATTEIYTLSLHDALPIFLPVADEGLLPVDDVVAALAPRGGPHGLEFAAHPRLGHGDRADDLAARDRKSTRLNSSHANISYAVFCLKKKKKLYILHAITAS